ncbi:hypothetical protein [Sphingobacterium siyangense]|uniref:hypothetical protein n=1 Tax=Sphingobacterium siyangense TaxID=459529 RepID=UPI002FDD913D
MEQVDFSPAGILLKQHELYGLADNLLMEQAMFLRGNIVAWARQNFFINDAQLNWLNSQDSSFTVDFAKTISDGFIGRFDFNIFFNGPADVWKSKRVSAKQQPKGVKAIDIFVEYIK